MSATLARHRNRPAFDPKLVRISLADIRPAPENEAIYRPVSAEDPEIIALAESIEAHDLLEPLVVTRDGYILSGHRRYAACPLAGLDVVPCRVEPIYRSDPRFIIVLRQHNQQRVKSFDKVVREQVLDAAGADPEEADQSLLAHRPAALAVSGQFIQITGETRRARITRAKQPMLNAAATIILGQQDYWPLSDRSIHYDMLNSPPLRHASKPDSRYLNDKVSYKDLTNLLTRARIAGEIPFDAIADPTRTVATWDVEAEVGGFFRTQLKGFLTGYWRDLQQSQPNHIEIVGEKNTIESSIRPVAMRYCIPYTIGRGNSSLDPRYQMVQWFRASGREKLIVLVMSDFDLEGEDIPRSFARSLRDDFGVQNVQARKVCLTYEQAVARNLPQTFDLKEKAGGARYKKFHERYGDRAHELEALTNEERARLLDEAIRDVLDIDAFNREGEAEQEDAARLAKMKAAVCPALRAALGEEGRR